MALMSSADGPLGPGLQRFGKMKRAGGISDPPSLVELERCCQLDERVNLRDPAGLLTARSPRDKAIERR